MIKYREYKKFSNEHIRNPLNEILPDNNELGYNSFEETILNLLFYQAPFRKRMVPANQRVFMNMETQKL